MFLNCCRRIKEVFVLLRIKHLRTALWSCYMYKLMAVQRINYLYYISNKAAKPLAAALMKKGKS